MYHAAQVGTTEERLTESQRKEALALEETANLRKQLEQRAAEAQHCNAKAEVCSQSFGAVIAYDGTCSRPEMTLVY